MESPVGNEICSDGESVFPDGQQARDPFLLFGLFDLLCLAICACQQRDIPAGSASCCPPMRFPLVAAAVALLACAVPSGASAISLNQACQRFADKLTAAQATGDTQKAQKIYAEGTKRIAGRFNGATCPNVQAPTP